ncbi:MAG: hypothetical protein EBU59_11955 [Planctomycetia bacterium]|nr:hypothetical protein [Planctomycetia bacterium]
MAIPFPPSRKTSLKPGIFAFPTEVLRPPDLAGKVAEASTADGFGLPATGQIFPGRDRRVPTRAARGQIVLGNNATRYTRQQRELEMAV